MGLQKEQDFDFKQDRRFGAIFVVPKDKLTSVRKDEKVGLDSSLRNGFSGEQGTELILGEDLFKIALRERRFDGHFDFDSLPNAAVRCAGAGFQRLCQSPNSKPSEASRQRHLDGMLGKFPA